MRVSHESIYLSLFVQSRGALPLEALGFLRGAPQARQTRPSAFASLAQLSVTVNIRSATIRPQSARIV
jgi:hypothetical protein